MSFVEIAPPNKNVKPPIQPDEILLTTRKVHKCNMVVLRFGDDAMKRLKLHVGRQYMVRWGIDDHAGKLRLSEVTKGWELKVPKRGNTAQITLSRLPDQYEGRSFQAKKITGEHIDGVQGRSDPFVQLVLPSDFFAEPEETNEQE
ncbi:hypothetical protein [Thalassospira alkalitolerans]|uniref:hypothetical protein n=1 Tax=Thalassospira alkalitolerans TaxID=1293890 RepID=UPI0030EF9406|tara:strand:+ start:7181 stop:7615 length:435 start_codon:yes stop_codon:yes gene_type:complete